MRKLVLFLAVLVAGVGFTKNIAFEAYMPDLGSIGDAVPQGPNVAFGEDRAVARSPYGPAGEGSVIACPRPKEADARLLLVSSIATEEADPDRGAAGSWSPSAPYLSPF